LVPHCKSTAQFCTVLAPPLPLLILEPIFLIARHQPHTHNVIQFLFMQAEELLFFIQHISLQLPCSKVELLHFLINSQWIPLMQKSCLIWLDNWFDQTNPWTSAPTKCLWLPTLKTMMEKSVWTRNSMFSSTYFRLRGAPWLLTMVSANEVGSRVIRFADCFKTDWYRPFILTRNRTLYKKYLLLIRQILDYLEMFLNQPNPYLVVSHKYTNSVSIPYIYNEYIFPT
jgi:hypothetical protein